MVLMFRSKQTDHPSSYEEFNNRISCTAQHQTLWQKSRRISHQHHFLRLIRNRFLIRGERLMMLSWAETPCQSSAVRRTHPQKITTLSSKETSASGTVDSAEQGPEVQVHHLICPVLLASQSKPNQSKITFTKSLSEIQMATTVLHGAVILK